MTILRYIDLLIPWMPFPFYLIFFNSVRYENVSIMPYIVKFNFDEVYNNYTIILC